MSGYVVGVLTIPAILVAYALLVTVGSRVVGWWIRAIHAAAFRLIPNNRSFQRRMLASSCYGSQSGFVLTAGRLGIVFLYGKTDSERKAWAEDRLIDTFDLDAHLAEARNRPGTETTHV